MVIWYGHIWPKYIIVYLGIKHYRRKFRSQTSDNMDRWKSRGGKSQRGEEPKREDQRRERVRRKKMQVREKVEQSQNTVFFQWFVALEGRKVGSLKRRVCGAMWSDERWKVARRCGAKHISKSKCTKHTNIGPLLEVEMSKSARRCGAKHILKSKCTKHTNLGPLLEVEMLKKCTPLWLEADFQVKSVKNWRARRTLGRSDVVSWGRRKGLCTLSKVRKTWGFCSSCNYNHHYTTLHSTTTTTTIILHYTTLITRQSITTTATLHSTPLHYTTLTTATAPTTTTVHYTTLHATPLHDTTLHSITLQLQQCYTTLH